VNLQIASDAQRRRFVQVGPVGLLSRALAPQVRSAVRSILAEGAVSDALFVRCGPPTGLMCILVVPLQRTTVVPRHRRRALEQVSAHVAAGLRLAAEGSSRARGSVAPEAILDTRGRILDAHGEATTRAGLRALRAAAIASETARGRLRRSDPEQALG